ncbi:hypothetical protein DFH27DRAFT_538011 [Peziza echinospora]|nr:hypothetical protein DFH27DRAFT_538011 [Peziza echinospora]
MGVLLNKAHRPQPSTPSHRSSDVSHSSARHSPLPGASARSKSSHQPSPLPVNPRPPMDVKSLISFFNHKCKPPVEIPVPDAVPEPVYTPNGKVKHLVEEFSKSPRSPRSLTTVSTPEKPRAGKPRSSNHPVRSSHGGDSAEPGVLQEPSTSGLLSRQTDGAGLVSPVQYQGSPQQHPISEQQQYEEPQEPPVGLVPVVDEPAEAKPIKAEHHRTKPTHRSSRAREQSRARHPAPSIFYGSAATSTLEVSRITGMSPDGEKTTNEGRRHQQSPAFTSLSRIQNLSEIALSPSRRVGSVESVVVSARNSVLRKLRFTGLLSPPNPKPDDFMDIQEETERKVELTSDFEEDFTSRLASRSTDPPPLRIVKAKKADPVTGITHNLKHPASTAEKRPTHLAPPPTQIYMRNHHSTDPAAPQMTVRPEHCLRRRDDFIPAVLEQSEENMSDRSGTGQGERYGEKPKYVPSHFIPPSVHHDIGVARLEPEAVYAARNMRKRERSRANRKSQPMVMPYFLADRHEKPYKTAPRPGAPRRKIYDDVEWRKHGRFVLRGNVDDAEESERDDVSHSLYNNLDGTSASIASWSSHSAQNHRSHPYLMPTRPIVPPLTPPRGQFRNYILNPEDTAGQFHTLHSDHKMKHHYAPEKSLAEELKHQRHNPRFATFHKQDPFLDEEPSKPLGRERWFIRSPASALKFRQHLERAEQFAQGRGTFDSWGSEEARSMRGSPISSAGRRSIRRRRGLAAGLRGTALV